MTTMAPTRAARSRAPSAARSAAPLLGVAALAIPGVGPLAAAGAIAASAVPEAAAIGAAVGVPRAAFRACSAKEGVDDDDAEYYEGRINEGGYFVEVHADRAGTSIEEAREILFRNGGHSAKRRVKPPLNRPRFKEGRRGLFALRRLSSSVYGRLGIRRIARMGVRRSHCCP